MKELIIDGLDLKALGLFRLSDLADPRNLVERELTTATVNGRSGGVFTVGEGLTKPVDLAFAGMIEGTDLADLQSKRDDLASILRVGLLEVALGDDETRHWQARFLEGSLPAVSPVLGDNGPVLEAELKFRAANPHMRSSTDTTVNLTGSYTDCPLGTARVEDAVLQIDGAVTPVTDPSFEYADSASGLLKTLAFKSGSVSLGSGEFLKIDFGTLQVTDDTTANRRDDLIVDTDHPIFLDPNDGVFRTSTWPKARLQAASGTPTGTLVYRRRWE